MVLLDVLVHTHKSSHGTEYRKRCTQNVCRRGCTTLLNPHESLHPRSCSHTHTHIHKLKGININERVGRTGALQIMHDNVNDHIITNSRAIVSEHGQQGHQQSMSFNQLAL